LADAHEFVWGVLATDVHMAIRVGAHILTWATAAFCLMRGLPVLMEGWRYVVGNAQKAKSVAGEAA
jgi:hypothetical protein